MFNYCYPPLVENTLESNLNGWQKGFERWGSQVPRPRIKFDVVKNAAGTLPADLPELVFGHTGWNSLPHAPGVRMT